MTKIEISNHAASLWLSTVEVSLLAHKPSLGIFRELAASKLTHNAATSRFTSAADQIREIQITTVEAANNSAERNQVVDIDTSGLLGNNGHNSNRLFGGHLF